MNRFDKSMPILLVLFALLVTWLAAGPVRAQVVVARQGDVAPRTSGGTFNIFSSRPAINDLGHVAFQSSISGGTSTQGVFLDRGTGLVAIALVGDVAPGSGGGTFVLMSEPALNASGDLVFAASVSGGSFGPAIFLYTGGQLSAIATSLDTAPGTITGTYSSFGPRLSMNASREVAFHANVSGAGSTSSGIFVEASQTSRAVLLRGEASPAALPGIYTSFSEPTINAAGDVVAIASIDPTVGGFKNGIIVESGGVDEIVALVGDPAPGTGMGVFFELSFAAAPAINASRQVFFYGKVSGGTVSHGLFVDDGVTQSAVALPGQPAPGSGGANYFAFSLSRLTANDSGAVGFATTLNSAIQAVFVGPTGSTAQSVAKSGDPVAGTGGGTIVLLISNPAINSSGRAAFVAQLTGGSSASAIIAVPEPGAFESALVAVALLAYAARRSKRHRTHAEA